MKLIVASALFALSTVPFVACQQPDSQPAPAAEGGGSSTYTLHRNIGLVFLDGVAVDAKGIPVKDLTKEDFVVMEDGVLQHIRNFESPGRFSPTADADIESTADLDRIAPNAPVNIVLLDEVNTRFEDMAFARYSLKKWLELQPAKLDTPTMLVSVSLDHFQVLRDYSQNKDEILSALDKHFAAYPWHINAVTWNSEMLMSIHLALRQVANATSGHHGPKSMIWLGRGFPSSRHEKVRVDKDSKGTGTTQHTINELREGRVTLYTIDPAGVMIDPDEYNHGRDASPGGGDPKFEAIAISTGGVAMHGRNDVDAEIGTAIHDGANIYTLTYTPSNDDNPEVYRKIKVTVNRPGVTFQTRPGYFPFRAARMKDDGKGRMLTEMASAGLNNMQYDAVRFTAGIGPEDINNIHVHLTGEGISYYIPSDPSKPRHTRLVVSTTTFDKKDKALKSGGASYDIQAPEASHIGHITKPLDLKYVLTPDPKATRVRVLVRVEASGLMGSVDLPLTAGATGSTAKVGNAAANTPEAPAPAPQAPPAS
jgi:VWFA-related protein